MVCVTGTFWRHIVSAHCSALPVNREIMNEILAPSVGNHCGCISRASNLLHYKSVTDYACMRTNNVNSSNQGRTYPLGKGRRLPWAPKSQGPPKVLFIYEKRIKRGHANVVYYHDNRLCVIAEITAQLLSLSYV